MGAVADSYAFESSYFESIPVNAHGLHEMRLRYKLLRADLYEHIKWWTGGVFTHYSVLLGFVYWCFMVFSGALACARAARCGGASPIKVSRAAQDLGRPGYT